MNHQLFFSVILLIVHPTLSQHCTAACMSHFQTAITDVTGSGGTSSALMAPFHKIIVLTEDNKDTYKQMKHLCTKVKNWETCVRSCSRDSARSILLSSMDQWKKYCAVMRKPSKATNDYLNCERTYQRQVSTNCNGNISFTYSITVFCKAMEKYQECSKKFKYYCSGEALQIKNSIDTTIQQTFSKLMKFANNRIRLPQKCNMFHRSHHTHHRGKHTRGEVIHSNLNRPYLTNHVDIPTTVSTSDVFARQIPLYHTSDNCQCDINNCSSLCLTTLTPSSIPLFTTSTNSPVPTKTTSTNDISTRPSVFQSLVNFHSYSYRSSCFSVFNVVLMLILFAIFL